MGRLYRKEAPMLQKIQAVLVAPILVLLFLPRICDIFSTGWSARKNPCFFFVLRSCFEEQPCRQMVHGDLSSHRMMTPTQSRTKQRDANSFQGAKNTHHVTVTYKALPPPSPLAATPASNLPTNTRSSPNLEGTSLRRAMFCSPASTPSGNSTCNVRRTWGNRCL